MDLRVNRPAAATGSPRQDGLTAAALPGLPHRTRGEQPANRRRAGPRVSPASLVADLRRPPGHWRPLTARGSRR
jgi:hypothetical protein